MKITKSNKIANSIGDLSMVLTISVEETIATIDIGKAVGNNDGCIVDTSIGNEVGDDVGISDGIIDDKADIKVGAIDGIGDVGLSVGNLDEIDGMVEGTSVGVTDGIRVGWIRTSHRRSKWRLNWCKYWRSDWASSWRHYSL